MLHIDWTSVAKQIADKVQENTVKNTILKMRADVFIMQAAQGNSFEDAWKKADEAAKFFESKIK